MRAKARRMLLPTLDCHGCDVHILLPYRTFQDSESVDPYWPDDSPKLTWVCSSCLHCTSYEHGHIRWIHDSLIAKPHPDRGFWRIAIGCHDTDCTEPIVAYTDTIGQTTHLELGSAIAKAQPAPKCVEGHGPGQNWMPKQLDFIEWTGPVEYLH